MINEFQRRKLRALAEQARTTIKLSDSHIGAKEIIDISIALDRYELVKIALPTKSKIDSETILNAICASTGAEPISANRSEIAVYRRSSCGGAKHIEI